MPVRGRNYFDLNESQRRMFSVTDKKRIFISHKKEDRDYAKKVAEYVMDAGIDVYFDEFDSSINRNDPNSVVSAIKRGMELSTHMIVIFTNKALNSHWIPWEIGYGDATSTEIRIFKMNDIKRADLPEYLQVTKVLYDIYDLNNFIAEVKRTSKEILINEGYIRDYKSPLNKLKDSVEPIA